MFIPLVHVVDHDGDHDGLGRAGLVVSPVSVYEAYMGALGYIEYLCPSLVGDQLESHDVPVEILCFFEVFVVEECYQSVDCWEFQGVYLP